jgi:hypothetical protein
MISTKKSFKNNVMTPTERKSKVLELKKEHEDYFNDNNLKDALYIPKMAFRPRGKDDLHVSFFPSELKKEQDIYTEFVSMSYDCEDPKRTLYYIKHNPFWSEEFEVHESSSGFQTHLIPVSDLKPLKDITSKVKKDIIDIDFNIPNPDEKEMTVVAAIERLTLSIDRIANTLEKRL